MTGEFPTAEAADMFAEEVQSLIGAYPKHEGVTVLVVINDQQQGTQLSEIAEKLDGKVEVEVIREEI